MPWTDIKLNDGREIPGISFGSSRHSGDTVSTVDEAIHAGFDSIDTAQIYRSEGAVGQAIKQSGLSRDDLWITTKWSGLKSAKESIEDSLHDLGVDYVDLYLIHFPGVTKGDIPGSWKHLEEFKKLGYAKSIGVSNFEVSDLKELLSQAHVKPSVNQIPFHPDILLKQEPLVKYLKEHDIAIEGYSPLAPLWNDDKKSPVLKVVKDIAGKRDVPEERVLLAWSRAKGVIPVTSSSTKSRIESFIAAGDLKLTTEEVEAIDKAGYKTAKNAEIRRKVVTGFKWATAAGLVTYLALTRFT
ncbi:hypothetical protein I302_107961 [Kwoniella bestiolae CBS 10118]|uniref:NADP-dependent oxidoreductase domain-containing protein n=1 Tax=Kwoniella bestiolae CBS 10118 TaxID=1296100 RepID=A0A1B9FX46_9TREE|nr:hypothetical protein I302_07675 [Kwoniella bestiolae CBS 10118]OCF23321.1 hypothetical protein I302_07675 [Kwoniella bestiolae CBS 10118]